MSAEPDVVDKAVHVEAQLLHARAQLDNAMALAALEAETAELSAKVSEAAQQLETMERVVSADEAEAPAPAPKTPLPPLPRYDWRRAFRRFLVATAFAIVWCAAMIRGAPHPRAKTLPGGDTLPAIFQHHPAPFSWFLNPLLRTPERPAPSKQERDYNQRFIGPTNERYEDD